MLKLATVSDLLRGTFQEWQKDNVSQLAAALAFYTVFSLAPVLIIIIAMASLVFGEEAAHGEIVTHVRGLVGAEGAKIIQTVLAAARERSSAATLVGIGTLLFGATIVFVALQEALNTMWDVVPKPESSVRYFVKKRLLSFSLVLGIGFLLMVFLLASATLSATKEILREVLPIPSIVVGTANFIFSFAVVTLLFAIVYKILPDVRIAWNDVWIGAAATSLLFTIGKGLIGIYLARGTLGSTYGAAGSFVVFLIWVYYSAQIFFLGAEFTQVYARRYGSCIVPAKDAVQVIKTSPSAQPNSPAPAEPPDKGDPAGQGERPSGKVVAAPPGDQK